MPPKKTTIDKETEFRKVRTPREGEILGVVVKMMGFDRLQVKCTDGKTRLCRIRGKMKKRVWIREGDVVLVAPWDFQDEKGDIMWRYSKGQARWLEDNSYLQGI
ncbi:MAG: translation initiation factor eIF-1A [Candidatus Jordarchaeum sp.]|uniref:translation initiation factor eIF-1A n=1 Tax=Candidatus Jordarchaeum sp. TaxID=2823881 RepID=UPI00404B222B